MATPLHPYPNEHISDSYEIVVTSAGVKSIKDIAANEIMHNPVGPWVEANHLYIQQSQLEQKLRSSQRPTSDSDLVIFDVGLGAAANAIASLACFDKVLKAEGTANHLKIISFEKNLKLLEFTLLNADHFQHLTPYHEAIRSILETHKWESKDITWELRHGDFLELILSEQISPDIIYFDPYSSKVNTELWSLKTFKKIFNLTQKNPDQPSTLFTYSQATPVRVGLLLAGFYVGYGSGIGFKESTTVASTHIQELQHPLDSQWLKRWSRSQNQHPIMSEFSSLEDLQKALYNHPQFKFDK